MRKTGFSILLLLLALTLTACSATRTAFTAEEFTACMEELGWVVMDVTEQMPNEDAETVIVALSEDYSYQVQFFVLPTAQQAVSAFDLSMSEFEESKGSSSSYTSLSGQNYHTYKLNSGDFYYVVSQTDNTVVLVTTEQTNKDKVDEALKALGY